MAIIVKRIEFTRYEKENDYLRDENKRNTDVKLRLSDLMPENNHSEHCAELLDAYLSAGSAKRADAARELFAFLAEDCPITPVLFRRAAVLTHRGQVTGVSPTQYNAFYGITDWIIKTQ